MSALGTLDLMGSGLNSFSGVGIFSFLRSRFQRKRALFRLDLLARVIGWAAVFELRLLPWGGVHNDLAFVFSLNSHHEALC